MKKYTEKELLRIGKLIPVTKPDGEVVYELVVEKQSKLVKTVTILFLVAVWGFLLLY